MLSKRIKMGAINRVTMAKIEKSHIYQDVVPQFHVCPFSNKTPAIVRGIGGGAFCKSRCGEIFPSLNVMANCPCNFIGPIQTAEKFWKAMNW